MSFTRAARYICSALLAFGTVTLIPAPASAQVAVTGAVDFSNRYNFRGIRQNTDGFVVWPYIDLGGTVHKGDGGLKSVSINVGMWNSLNSQLDDNKWYEADYYGTLGLGFGGGVSLGTTYTSYTSPGDYFTHVKEIMFKLAVDDSAALGKGAIKPYAILAFELATEPGKFQADAGAKAGRYLELGVGPGYAGSKASLAVPIKVGLSVGDYYEFGTGEDSTFGYFSIAGIVTVPLGPKVNIHGGIEFQAYGDTVKAYNGEDSTGIGTIGLGFSF